MPKAHLSHLQEPNSDHDPELHAGVPLQRARPWALARESPVEPCRAGHGGRRERPGHVLHAPEAAALEGILDRPDGLGVLAAEEPLPQGGELAVPRGARRDVAGVYGGEDGGEDALEDLGECRVRGVEQGPGRARGGLAGEVREREGVCCGEHWEQNGQEGQDWGQREGERDAVYVLVSDGTCQFDLFGIGVLPLRVE